MALAGLPLLILTVGMSSLNGVWVHVVIVVAQLSLGSACCYSAARILRPSRERTTEQVWRHGLAAAATSAALWLAGVGWVTGGLLHARTGDSFIIALYYLGGAVYLLVPVTLLWGLAVLITRRLRRRPTATDPVV